MLIITHLRSAPNNSRNFLSSKILTTTKQKKKTLKVSRVLKDSKELLFSIA